MQLHAQPVPQHRDIDVLHYAADIQPDIAAGTIEGRVVIRLVAASNALRTIELDNDGLTVDAVQEVGTKLRFAQDGKRLKIQLSRPARVGEQREIAVDYHGAPRFGLQFHPGRSQT